MFEDIRPRESAVEACVRQIRGAILRGELFPSERLPPERKLAETFGVNRMTLRSALTQLASSGLLSVRQGSGYQVQDFRRTGGPDLLPGLAEIARHAGDLEGVAADLLLMRRHMARAVFERIASRGRPRETQGVRDAIERFVETVRGGGDVGAIANADMDVLAAILGATGSPILGLCLNPVLAVLAELPELREAIYAEPESNALAYGLLSAWLDDLRDDLLDPLFTELERRDEATLDRIARAS
jgi:DNA-binding FadR family transcriptional regulator